MENSNPPFGDIERIHEILSEVDFTHKRVKGQKKYRISWNGLKSEAVKLARRNDKIVQDTNCSACNLHLYKSLLELVGGTLDDTAGQTLKERRLDICYGCEFYRSNTKSCGTLILGAINRSPGEPCGCFLPLAASFKSHNCPKGKWDVIS